MGSSDTGNYVGGAARACTLAAHREIYVLSADGGNPWCLTDDPADDMRSTWSPDGQQIAFDSERDGNWQVYVVRPDGSDLRRLTDNPEWEVFPAWSPDGAKIAYRSSAARDCNGDVWVMDAHGSNKLQLTHEPSNDENPSWSPDGQHIVFQSDRYADPRTKGSDTYNFELVIMDADGGNVRRLTHHPAGDYWRAWGPAPDAGPSSRAPIWLDTAAQAQASRPSPANLLSGAGSRQRHRPPCAPLESGAARRSRAKGHRPGLSGPQGWQLPRS